MNNLKNNFINELSEIAIENNLFEKCELISEKCEKITDDFSVKLLIWYNSDGCKKYYESKNPLEVCTYESLQQYFKNNIYGKE